jgi:thymidine kinase
MSAKLRFYHGVMGSSKSLRLLATAHDFDEKNIPILVLKPSADTRDGLNIVKSRAGLERECISVDSTLNLYNAINEYNHIRMAELSGELKWILVDECQFLTEEQVEQLSDVVDYLGINVICYGLRTDFKSKLFPASKRLFELADDIEEIKTSCQCGNKASINARFSPDGEIITEGNQILVGGDDLYRAICRKDWKNLIRKKK